MPDHHVKGQPAASMYVQEKGCVKCYTFCDTPCSCNYRVSKSSCQYLYPLNSGPGRYILKPLDMVKDEAVISVDNFVIETKSTDQWGNH